MSYRVTVLPQQFDIKASAGENLLSLLISANLAPDTPCGGQGKCGKCRVLVDGQSVLACQTAIHRDMTVQLPDLRQKAVLTDGPAVTANTDGAYTLAFDIGTTTVAGFLLRGDQELARESRFNPQAVYGADVISRIRHAICGESHVLTHRIRACLSEMITMLCRTAGLSEAAIQRISIVGNPAMQQLFLGLSVENLATIPYSPVLTEAKTVPAREYLPALENAELLIVPNISGFVGADTVACVLSCLLDKAETPTLLIDIGTNGEMVLGDGQRLVACATAAGPALEGANISCGMCAATGAIDRVWWENDRFSYHVIGEVAPIGICGSGLLDAVAAAIDAGLINPRGRILNADHSLHLADTAVLTQEDIRQVQAAKGAIAAGITLMTQALAMAPEDIHRVLLAGAFGNYLDPRSACRIGLLPRQLQERIKPIGNAAGSGAKLLAADPTQLTYAQNLAQNIAYLDLAKHPDFPKLFAKHMML